MNRVVPASRLDDESMRLCRLIARGDGFHLWMMKKMVNAAQDAAGDFDLRCPTRMAARVFASQGRPTFLYSYDHPPYESVNQGMPIRSSYLGAFHGAEVPSFVLCLTTPSFVL